ncbi:nucleotidyltransferase domain-containing protein [Pyrococcus kukulkanii]|uniref:nucleotidyltransferase domain-containing protein n=1 Tax=Pyrococcus kukulkanii TaxID=1609559 RepID=UPI0035622075
MEDRIMSDIRKYIETLKKHGIDILLAVIFGSFTKGTYGLGSDVDLFIVARGLPEDFDERLKLLYLLNETETVIDPKAYTPEEVEKMFAKGHLFLFELSEHGKVIYVGDDKYSKEFFRNLRALKGRYKRINNAWIRVV